MAEQAKIAVDLGPVPETLLWTLYFRAIEARRPDTVLPDPIAVELVDRIDYPFQERFAGDNPTVTAWTAQWQALRARTFDEEVRRFLDAHPDGTVVALGEGLETQFRRVDNGRAQWVSVDLPESIALRHELLPESPRQRTVAGSAPDLRWAEEVDASRGVLVTAQGLMMYLRPAEVRDLISGCAERFPSGAMLFDAMPRWFTDRTRRGAMRTGTGYQAPPMPWGMDRSQLPQLGDVHPNIVEVRDLPLPPGRGFFFARVAPRWQYVPVLRGMRPSIVLLRFGGTSQP